MEGGFLTPKPAPRARRAKRRGYVEGEVVPSQWWSLSYHELSGWPKASENYYGYETRPGKDLAAGAVVDFKVVLRNEPGRPTKYTEYERGVIQQTTSVTGHQT